MILFLEQLCKSLEDGRELAFCRTDAGGREVIRMVLVDPERYATHDFDLDALRQAHFPGIAFAVQLEALRHKLSDDDSQQRPAPGPGKETIWP